MSEPDPVDLERTLRQREELIKGLKRRLKVYAYQSAKNVSTWDLLLIIIKRLLPKRT